MKRNLFLVCFNIFLIFGMLLTSCSPAPLSKSEPIQDIPTMDLITAEPTAGPVRHGGWLDEIDYSTISDTSTLAQMNAGVIDLDSSGMTPDKIDQIKDSGLCYAQSQGVYYGILFNPAVFTDITRLNPFTNHRIREAMNWAVDRDYINKEIFAGGVLPKTLPIITQMMEYSELIEEVRNLEAYYAYDMDKAKAVVDTEMVAMGAEKGTDGRWSFSGAPVNLIFLIRNDGDRSRLSIGEYFAQQLEALGFTVERDLGDASKLSPIWLGSDQPDGLWNIYTAGWGTGGFDRDEKWVFQAFYLPSGGNEYNVPDPLFEQVGDDLGFGNFTTLEQRHDLMVEALPLALQDSSYVWIADLQVYYPHICDLEVTVDPGAGVQGTKMTSFNLRYTGVVGGVLRSAFSTGPFINPWNPVNGGNWSSSAFIKNAVSGDAYMPDPYTGLVWPLRIEKADLVVQTGLPVTSTLDWVNLSFEDSIPVPGEAWVDWDTATQTFITAEQKFPEGTTARTKSVVYYPADMFEDVKWQAGGNLSLADFVMAFIMIFDYQKEGSAIYDEDAAFYLEWFLSHFKGLQILSTDPLTIATYDDTIYSGAELILKWNAYWWPRLLDEAPWETFAIGNMAVANLELGWGEGQADRTSTEWLSLIGGPSLEILNKYLDQAIAEKIIPYEATMGDYLTAEEAAVRYTALKDWYTTHGHFWNGTGPYYLDSVDLNNQSAVVKNNFDYVDTADRWSSFSLAPLGTVILDGPAQVKTGIPVEFTAYFTNKASGDPYPNSGIKAVKFLVFDAQGKNVFTGVGEVSPGEEGIYTFTVPAEITSRLGEGSGRIEVAGTFLTVAIPAIGSQDFVILK